MQTSNLPANLVVLFLFILSGSALISGCTSSKTITPTLREERSRSPAAPLININTANESEIEKLPHVGPGLAQKIVQHRETYGPFRRPEHLLVIDGLSEKRFLEFRRFINTE